jgi:hypothetical protein
MPIFKTPLHIRHVDLSGTTVYGRTRWLSENIRASSPACTDCANSVAAAAAAAAASGPDSAAAAAAAAAASDTCNSPGVPSGDNKGSMQSASAELVHMPARKPALLPPIPAPETGSNVPRLAPGSPFSSCLQGVLPRRQLLQRPGTRVLPRQQRQVSSTRLVSSAHAGRPCLIGLFARSTGSASACVHSLLDSAR